MENLSFYVFKVVNHIICRGRKVQVDSDTSPLFLQVLEGTGDDLELSKKLDRTVYDNDECECWMARFGVYDVDPEWLEARMREALGRPWKTIEVEGYRPRNVWRLEEGSVTVTQQDIGITFREHYEKVPKKQTTETLY